ncbi:hypothetical protein B0O80DRAFT_457366 [Mortierella sp. GBAus27b]|nr:hypothetical protein B0O80DRAFT_457366 [Mortierella sp. GBAus27b]
MESSNRVQAPLFEGDETMMDGDLDCQFIGIDDLVDSEGSSYRLQPQQFSGQQRFQPFTFLTPDHVGTAMSYASSIMDVGAESTDSGSSSKSMTPRIQVSEDGPESRRPSRDMGDSGSGGPVITSIAAGHRISSPESADVSSVLTKVSNMDFLGELRSLQQQPLSQADYTTGLNSIRSTSSDMGDTDEDPAFKRAEQNRAAQRAFRQRKQQYIKWLESKAEELDEVYRIMTLVRTENQHLRKLVMELDAALTGSRKETDISTSSSLRGPPGSKVDLSLSREIALRLMNLASFSGMEATDSRTGTAVGRPKYQPRSSSSKGGRAKGRSSYKLQQIREQQQQQMLMLQNQQAIQLQEQYQERERQRQQQQRSAPLVPTSDFLSMSSCSQPLLLARSAVEQTHSGASTLTPMTPIGGTMPVLSTHMSSATIPSMQPLTQPFSPSQSVMPTQQRSLSTPALFATTSPQRFELGALQRHVDVHTQGAFPSSFQYGTVNNPPSLVQQPQLVYQQPMQHVQHMQQAQQSSQVQYQNQHGYGTTVSTVPQFHPSRAEVPGPLQDDDMTGAGRVRRSSMPTLRLIPSDLDKR